MSHRPIQVIDATHFDLVGSTFGGPYTLNPTTSVGYQGVSLNLTNDTSTDGDGSNPQLLMTCNPFEIDFTITMNGACDHTGISGGGANDAISTWKVTL